MNNDNKNCYVQTFQWVMNNIHDPEDIRNLHYKVVHCTVEGKGKLEGFRFHHSFIRMLDFAIDPQAIAKGSNGIFDFQSYCDYGKIENAVEYSMVKYQLNCVKYGHYGPFDKL